MGEEERRWLLIYGRRSCVFLMFDDGIWEWEEDVG